MMGLSHFERLQLDYNFPLMDILEKISDIWLTSLGPSALLTSSLSNKHRRLVNGFTKQSAFLLDVEAKKDDLFRLSWKR